MNVMTLIPNEMWSHIFSFLPLADRFRSRRVSRTFKHLIEAHLLGLKSLFGGSGTEYGPSPKHPAGCLTSNICPEIIYPTALICILKYCPSIECLYIGDFPVAQSGSPNSPIRKEYWDWMQLAVVFQMMEQMPRLRCLSWIGLRYQCPHSLAKRLQYLFLPPESPELRPLSRVMRWMRITLISGSPPAAVSVWKYSASICPCSKIWRYCASGNSNRRSRF